MRTLLVRLTSVVLPSLRPSLALARGVNRLLQMMHRTCPEMLLSEMRALSNEQQQIIKVPRDSFSMGMVRVFDLPAYRVQSGMP